MSNLFYVLTRRKNTENKEIILKVDFFFFSTARFSNAAHIFNPTPQSALKPRVWKDIFLYLPVWLKACFTVSTIYIKVWTEWPQFGRCFFSQPLNVDLMVLSFLLLLLFCSLRTSCFDWTSCCLHTTATSGRVLSASWIRRRAFSVFWSTNQPFHLPVFLFFPLFCLTNIPPIS